MLDVCKLEWIFRHYKGRCEYVCDIGSGNFINISFWVNYNFSFSFICNICICCTHVYTYYWYACVVFFGIWLIAFQVARIILKLSLISVIPKSRCLSCLWFQSQYDRKQNIITEIGCFPILLHPFLCINGNWLLNILFTDFAIFNLYSYLWPIVSM